MADLRWQPFGMTLLYLDSIGRSLNTPRFIDIHVSLVFLKLPTPFYGPRRQKKPGLNRVSIEMESKGKINLPIVKTS